MLHIALVILGVMIAIGILIQILILHIADMNPRMLYLIITQDIIPKWTYFVGPIFLIYFLIGSKSRPFDNEDELLAAANGIRNLHDL
jgi:hypothetical protein